MKFPAFTSLLLLAACGGRQSSQTPEPRMASCSGNGFVEVINDWTRDVEVYAYAAESATGTSLGTVRPGQTSEFLLPRDAARAAAMEPGLTGPVQIPSRARARVRLRYLCR
jgi:hypothetical protein